MSIGYNGTKKYKGMEGFIFSVDSNTLQTNFPNPEHDCYCTKTVSDQSGTPSCFLDGVMDVQLCFSEYLYRVITMKNTHLYKKNPHSQKCTDNLFNSIFIY